MKTEVFQIYENRTDVTLTSYLLDVSPEIIGGQNRPAVLICPGGGYFYCSDREAEPVAMKFLSMGYHAFVLRYSTYGEGTHFSDFSKPLEVKEHILYPHAMREIGKAFLIIREHSKDWMVDVERIAVCGFSAGGHNAAMYATHWQEDVVTGYFHEKKEKFCPAALILGYPLTDYIFKEEKEEILSNDHQVYFHESDRAFLGSEHPAEELLYEVSPARHVTEYMPPTFLWATAQDQSVPVQHSVLLALALANANIPFEMHIFENGPHGMALANQATAKTKEQIDPDAAGWADLAGAWLEKRFALQVAAG